jgi:flavin-dependent dehydrogenase
VISSDVVIIGGGPGGSATAISLLAHAPALSVTLVEASRYETSRVGESLPPIARSLLETLDLWDAFSALGARQSFGTSAVWGHATSVDNEFIFMPANTGWQLDRASFDAMLANEAKKRGAVLMLDTSVRGVQKIDAGWRLSLSNGCILSSRFVVDATGGSALFARRAGARFVELDRLVGISRFFECGESDARLIVETFADGWWYTAGLPNGKRVTCCVTDADLAQRMKLSEAAIWQQQLSTTNTVAKITNPSKPCGTVTVRSTNSRLLDPVCGDDWLAVGDAASRFDPLSSQGIIKALRSGIFASYAIGDLLLRGDHVAMRRYRRFVREEFKSYLQTRLKYYRQEQRWPDSEFWRRRHAQPPLLRQRVEALEVGAVGEKLGFEFGFR